MEERAVRGVVWTLLSYGATKVITVLTTFALARLLVPADFGIVALATLAISVLGIVRDLGLGATLILRQDFDRRAQGTVLTLMVTMSVVVAVAIAAVSPLAARLFDEPRLTEVLLALSVIVVTGTFGWFYEALLQRELEFRRRFAGQLLQALTYTAVALSLAATGAGVWSLVVGQLVGSTTYCIVLLALAPYRVRPGFDRGAAIEAMRTGKGFLLQAGLAVVQQNADYFAVGRLLGTSAVGYYSMAYRIAELPYLGVADPVAKVTFPGFARMRDRGDDLTASFLSTLRLVALVTCPMGMVLCGAAEPLTRVMLGEQWLPAVGALSVLGVWAAVRTVQVTIAWLLNSVGEAGLMGVISLFVLVPLIPGLLVAADLGGIVAVAWVMVADMTLSLLVLGYYADRRTGIAMRRQWLAVRPVALACPVCYAAVALTERAVSGLAALPALTLATLAGTAAYLVAIRLADRTLLRDAAAQLRRLVKGAPATA